jgi:hypothetical protein
MEINKDYMNFGNARNTFTKLMEAKQAAVDLLNEHITPELEAEMSEEHLELLKEARSKKGEKELKDLAKKLEGLTNKIRK